MLSTSSHGNKTDEDHSINHADDKVFVTASKRFIAPLSALPRMRESLTNLFSRPQFPMDSSPTSPTFSPLSSKSFHSGSKIAEILNEDETQTAAEEDKGDEEFKVSVLITTTRIYVHTYAYITKFCTAVYLFVTVWVKTGLVHINTYVCI